MKKIIVSAGLGIILLLSFSVKSWTQSPEIDPHYLAYTGNCTSIMVGRLASSDGSVITSHTCNGFYRTWLEVFPHSHNEKGTMHPFYEGTFSMEDAKDMSKVTKKGEVPEVEETYAFLNTAYPCLNEKQLAMGETTLRGKKELRNQERLFKIEELAKIALQRCKIAREAIALIGKLAEEYGYGDYSPECLTIADTKEVWHLEISGLGKGKPSAIWCAARIPDDHVGVSANIPRISTIDFENPDMFMYSTDLKKVAKKLGYWDGNEPLKFWKVVGISRKAFDIREFYILSMLDPSLNLSFDAEELPFSVKPEKQLSVYDVMKFFRETYEGTPWDMTQNLMVTVNKKDDQGNEIEEKVKSPVVNNWMSWDLWMLFDQLKDGTFKFRYTIAQMMCSYSHVIQCRSWLPDEVGAIAWFSFDNPALSPRIPIFSSVLRLPSSFGICGQHRYRTDAALWSFRETNRLAAVNWSIGRVLIEPAVREFEILASQETPMVEKRAMKLISEGKITEAQEYLTTYTNSFAFATMKKWEELKATLWGDFRIWYR